MATIIRDLGRCVRQSRRIFLRAAKRKWLDAAANTECAALLNRVGGYFHGRGIYSEARPLFERAVAIYEKALGPEHPDTATSLNNLAGLLQDQGDLAGRGRCSSARWRSMKRRSAPSIPKRR